MSSQYNKQKSHDLEVKELLAEKVREMEKDYMLITIHEDGVRKLEATYETEIRKLRDEVHDYFERRIVFFPSPQNPNFHNNIVHVWLNGGF